MPEEDLAPPLPAEVLAAFGLDHANEAGAALLSPDVAAGIETVRRELDALAQAVAVASGGLAVPAGAPAPTMVRDWASGVGPAAAEAGPAVMPRTVVAETQPAPVAMPAQLATPVPAMAPGVAQDLVSLTRAAPESYAVFAPATMPATPATTPAPDIAVLSLSSPALDVPPVPAGSPASGDAWSERVDVSAAPGPASGSIVGGAAAPVAAMPIAAPAQAAPTAMPSWPSAAPVEARESGGPMQGDVYLDGTRMGRWIADRLARKAGRPAWGGTAFDPRMGVAWPGSLQGF